MSEEALIRILIVDDDLFTAELTGLVLESAGFDPTIAEGPLDALEKMGESLGFAAVVSDMNMPFMNGAELFEEIGKAGFSVPFVLLSGQDPESLKDVHPGIHAVLQKGESFHEDLPQILSALVGRG